MWCTQPAAGPLVRPVRPETTERSARDKRHRLTAGVDRAWATACRLGRRLHSREAMRALLGHAAIPRAASVRDGVVHARTAFARIVAGRLQRARQWRARFAQRRLRAPASPASGLGSVALGDGVRRWTMGGAMRAGGGALLVAVGLLMLMPALMVYQTGQGNARAPLTIGDLQPVVDTRLSAALPAHADGASATAGPSTSGGLDPRATAPRTLLKPTVASRRPVRPQASPARARTSSGSRFVGGLNVSSSPPGASVALNDRRVGSTPLRLKQLPVGTYAGRVDLAGFERWSRAIQVSSGLEVAIRPALRRQRVAGEPTAVRGSR
jgi:hypothetical protein